ncbi:hypothetical protein PHLCEN_2v11298 [Hermanssonia centrifuga]|uniref:Uncharacterized protein n=1 Tax=Hermanssonia centrifuga TaxID=98765 RepID=A0A2R6NKH0_9APHY|nr:hypothetical protein PHLCEN_2v11298 [Hermanssonia centrifuga]
MTNVNMGTVNTAMAIIGEAEEVAAEQSDTTLDDMQIATAIVSETFVSVIEIGTASAMELVVVVAPGLEAVEKIMKNSQDVLVATRSAKESTVGEEGIMTWADMVAVHRARMLRGVAGDVANIAMD